MLLFDTATLDVRERADAVSASMIDATLSTDLVHHDPADVCCDHGRRASASSTSPASPPRAWTRTRTSRQVADDEVPTVALSLGVGRRGVIEQDGSGDLRGTEHRQPGRADASLPVAHPARTDGWSVKIPLDELALPAGTIARARGGIVTSPVHAVFRQHLRTLGSQAGHLDAGMGNALLGTATWRWRVR